MYKITALLNQTYGHRFDEYVAGDELAKVGTFEFATEEVDVALDQMWQLGNRESGHDMFSKPWPREQRSLSAGDVLIVETNNVVTMVAIDGIGFRNL